MFLPSLSTLEWTLFLLPDNRFRLGHISTLVLVAVGDHDCYWKKNRDKSTIHYRLGCGESLLDSIFIGSSVTMIALIFLCFLTIARAMEGRKKWVSASLSEHPTRLMPVGLLFLESIPRSSSTLTPLWFREPLEVIMFQNLSHTEWKSTNVFGGWLTAPLKSPRAAAVFS